jgi:DNA-binding XRE family transcriptional regulator
MNATVQIIHKDGRPEWAVIPYEEYERLQVLAENQQDVAAFDTALQAIDAGEELIPAAVVDRLANGESPLKVWREYRGIGREKLAEKVGVPETRLVGIEADAELASPLLLEKLAEVLRVDVDDLSPT